ncbi:MAG: alpha/beta hydrolase [Pirellulaceae bacterium]|nr:alpha/beta hydrolase [Pirellulaceae bacterium]
MNYSGVALAAAVLLMFDVVGCRGQVPAKPDSVTVTKAQSLDERLLFFPSKFPEGDWEPKDLKYEDVYFQAEDGTKLHAWYCPAENPRAVVLVAHGNAGHVASRASWLRYLQQKANVSVLMFDYRGYGRSEGTPTVEGVIQDATAARAKLCELANIKDSEMLLMGESLGGAIVVQLATKSAPRGLIVQSTFSSLRDVADAHYPQLSWLVPPKKLDTAGSIANYQGPLLQSHGTADQTIPFSLGEKIFKNANEPKELVSIERAGHNDWMTDAYLKKLDQFIQQNVSEGKALPGRPR